VDLGQDFLSFRVVLAETDRDLARKDPRKVFASAVGQWACEMAVGMADWTTRVGGREAVVRLDETDTGGPWCETCSSRERAGSRCDGAAKAGACWSSLRLRMAGAWFRDAATSTSASRADCGNDGCCMANWCART
jgi:hypothetical protein